MTNPVQKVERPNMDGAGPFCKDGGTCHHACYAGQCLRQGDCAPLSLSGFDENWVAAKDREIADLKSKLEAAEEKLRRLQGPIAKPTMQHFIDAGINGFALELLSESLAGKKDIKTFNMIRFEYRGVIYTLEPAIVAEPVTQKKIKVAWIPGIKEYREIFDCDHGLYYCLDPGDGLPTHIKPEDGIEVKEMTEQEADAL